MADSVGETAKEVPAGAIRSAVRTGVAWNLVGQGTTQALRFFTGVLLARLLSPDDYGLAAVAVLLASAAPLLGDFGIGSALVQSASLDQRARSTAFWASATIGLLMALSGIALAIPAASFLGQPEAAGLIAVGAAMFFVCSLGSVPLALWSRGLRFPQVMIRYIGVLVLASIVAIAIGWSTHGPWALVIQQVVLAVGFASLLWVGLDWRPSLAASWEDFKRFWHFGARVATGRWLQLTEVVVTSLLIGRLVGISELGAWTFAANLVVLPAALVAAPISDVLFSGFSRMEGDVAKIGELWLHWVRWLAAVAFPALVAIALLAPDYVPLIFGEQWAVAVPLVQVLSLLAMIRVLLKWNQPVMDAVGRPAVTMYLSLASLVVSLTAIVLGSQIGGVEAAAILYVVFAALFVEAPSVTITLRQLGVPLSRVFDSLKGVLAATAAMAATCAFLQLALGHLGQGHLVVLLLATAGGGLAYLAVLQVAAPEVSRGMLRVVGRFRTGSARQAH